jgi:hypothetical protein
MNTALSISPFLLIFCLIFPVIIAGVLHMVVVRLNLFSSLRVPVNASLFGQNKTWRGFFIMILAGMCGMWALAGGLLGTMPSPSSSEALSLLFGGLSLKEILPSVLALGGAIGFAYALFELPNSYLKRRLGIPPGEQAQGNAWLFIILDRIDSATGCAVVYALWGIPWTLAALLIPLGIGVHLAVTIPLYYLGIKEKVL